MREKLSAFDIAQARNECWREDELDAATRWASDYPGEPGLNPIACSCGETAPHYHDENGSKIFGHWVWDGKSTSPKGK